MDEPKREVLRVTDRGAIELPAWLWQKLYDMSGIRSRKKRHIKKAVKRMFHVAIMKGLEAERLERAS